MPAKTTKPAKTPPKAKSKKEIDKDIMYSKIMPTGLADLRRQPEPDEAPPVPAAQPAAAEPAVQGAPGDVLFFKRSGVQIREKSHTVVINVMEYLVSEKLDSAFDKFNCCKCDKCRKDVAALALNKLAPKYVVADPDHIPDLISQQMSAEVTASIVKAILTVRAHPRH